MPTHRHTQAWEQVPSCCIVEEEVSVKSGEGWGGGRGRGTWSTGNSWTPRRPCQSSVTSADRFDHLAPPVGGQERWGESGSFFKQGKGRRRWDPNAESNLGLDLTSFLPAHRAFATECNDPLLPPPHTHSLRWRFLPWYVKESLRGLDLGKPREGPADDSSTDLFIFFLPVVSLRVALLLF